MHPLVILWPLERFGGIDAAGNVAGNLKVCVVRGADRHRGAPSLRQTHRENEIALTRLPRLQ
jgi:hypothetical protein